MILWSIQRDFTTRRNRLSEQEAEPVKNKAPKALRDVNETEFAALVRGLVLDVVDAHIHWGQLTLLEKEMNARPDVSAQAYTFWHYTRVAHRQTALASLARVFDQEPGSLHMRSFLEAIRDHLHLFNKEGISRRRPDDPFVKMMSPEAAKPDPAQLARDIDSCSTLDPDIKALNRFRSNLLAHRGAKLTRQDDVDKSPPLLVEQVKRLLDRAKTLLNRYSFMFDNSGYSMVPHGHGDLVNIFDGVERDLNPKFRD